MSVISFKCPNCDGELIFDPASGAYKCEYCGSKFTQEELDAMKPAEEQEKPAGSMDGSQAPENTDGTQEEKKTEEEAVIGTENGWRWILFFKDVIHDAVSFFLGLSAWVYITVIKRNVMC